MKERVHITCPSCKEGILSFAAPVTKTFYDEHEPDEKYWRVTFESAHCWVCGKTQLNESPKKEE